MYVQKEQKQLQCLIGPPPDPSLMPAQEHDHAPSYDVKPTPLLSKDSTKASAAKSPLWAAH
ncbi:hypothetical protein Scep_022423 [Stephania cephalantha]|uniref:Uncharacterized protein n=1 Tax=Stephania cephalantha TaxID=152367 RepID=A0AAP0FHH6_9MAGN